MTTREHYSKTVLELAETAKQQNKSFLIYGCYGYTGELTAQLIEELKLQDMCILGGRDKQKVLDVAKKYHFDKTVAFSLDNAESELKKLQVSAVLHCAGPFEITGKPMIDACVNTGISYLDITGEIGVFEYSLANNSMNKRAQDKKIVVMSGVGFDIVPSDCLAKSLTEEFEKKHGKKPDELEMCLDFGNAQLSRGTTKSMILGAAKPEVVRRGGKLVTTTKFHTNKFVRYPGDKKDKAAVSVPWGDISTAYHSTGVPNVTVLFTTPKHLPPLVIWIINTIIVQWLLILLFKIPIFVTGVNKLVERFMPAGPNKTFRNDHRGTRIIGFVKDDKNTVTGHLKTGEGYTFTAEASLLCTLRVLAGQVNKYGCVTPSVAFSSSIVKDIPQTVLHID